MAPRRSFSLSGSEVVRRTLGSLLLLAAMLKGYQLATEPVLGTGVLDSRWFLIAVVEFETLFGLWLWAGTYAKPTWVATICCFTAFGGVSLWKALAGEASCGCFGKVSVNPWYTFSLDVVALGALCYWRPAARPRVAGDFKSLRRRVAGVAMVWMLVGIPAGLVVGSFAAEMRNVLGDSQTTILEPETWVGKPFLLAEHIDLGSTLQNGTWIVLLYRHGCPACRDAVSNYQQLARDFSGRSNSPGIAIIECPPYAAESSSAAEEEAVRGRLLNYKRWKVSTPVSMLIDEGKVKSVFDDPRDTALLRAIWGS